MKNIEKYIMIILIFIAVGAIGAAVYFGINADKDISKKEDNKQEEVLGDESKETDEETNEQTSDEDDKNEEESDDVSGEALKEFSNYDKAIKIIETLPVGIKKASDLNNQQKLGMIFENNNMDGESTKEEMVEVAKTLFGKNVEIEFENVKCATLIPESGFTNQVLYHYDKFNEKYFVDEETLECNEGYDTREYHKLISEENNDNEYILKVYSLYSNFYHIGVPEKFYLTKEDALNDNKPLNITDEYWNSDITEWDSDKIFADYKNKLNVETYTFIKENGNLIFDSVKTN